MEDSLKVSLWTGPTGRMNLKRTLGEGGTYSSIGERQMDCHPKPTERDRGTERNVYDHGSRPGLYRGIGEFPWDLSMTERYARSAKARGE